MNTKRYWIKQNVDVALLNNFCYVFNHRAQQVKVAARLNRRIPIGDIVPGQNSKELYGMYVEVMDIYVKNGSNYDYQKTALWKKDWEDAPKSNKKQVQKRFTKFFALFDSIKKKGHLKFTNKQVRLLDIKGKARANEIRGNRFSEKYYRINGMKRCFISKYLGIETIPCRILKIRIVQI